MNIDELQWEIARCTACAALFRGRHVDPAVKTEPLVVRPIVGGAAGAPVMLVGRHHRVPDREGIRALLERHVVPRSRFDEVDYQTSVTKCFPGRRLRSAARAERGQLRKEQHLI